MYFSFRRICSILERLHSVFPRGVSTFRRSRASLIWRRLRPSRNRLKIILMCSASSGTISGSPSSPFLYPSILEYGKANLPWLYPFRLPHLTLLLRDSLSPLGKGAGPCEEYFAGHTGGIQPFFFKPDDDPPVL